MTLSKRLEFLKEIKSSGFSTDGQVYLFFGERYLCKEAADMLERRLLGERSGAVNSIDGDQEDPGQTLARLMSFSLLPGRQVYRITDSRIFHSKTVSDALWTKAHAAFSAFTGHERPHVPPVRGEDLRIGGIGWPAG